MATRLYLGVAVLADPQPAYAADWTTTTSGTRIQLNGAPDDSALIVSTRTETSTGAVRALGSQWISGPMAAGSISGTIEVAVRTSTNNVASGVQMYMVAKVVSRDGNTLRGVLYAGLVGLVYSTTLQVVSSGTVAISTVAASAGDRVVVELGHNFNNIVATSYNGSFSLGSPVAAADLTNTNGTTAANRPWVEFSTTLPLLNEAVMSAYLVETMAVVDPPNILMSAMWAEAIGTQTPVEAVFSTLWAEVIGRQLPVEAALTTMWAEVLGQQKPVEAALTTTWVEVMGVPGEPPVAPTEGVQNVTRSGWLKILHPSGVWKTPKARGLPTPVTYDSFTSSGTFTPPVGVTAVDVLVVAGGGAGGNSIHGGGGGGGGGVRWVTSLAVSGPVTVTVGNGGNPAGTVESAGGDGQNSSFGDLVAVGGGGGGGNTAGRPGGSGGGGAGNTVPDSWSTGEAGTAGQGHAGGQGLGSAFNSERAGGGGGGALAAGGNATLGLGGQGGAGWNGATYGITGIFGAGGQGGISAEAWDGVDGLPGSGNGGSGGGHNGGWAGDETAGGAGGKGRVVVAYLL